MKNWVVIAISYCLLVSCVKGNKESELNFTPSENTNTETSPTSTSSTESTTVTTTTTQETTQEEVVAEVVVVDPCDSSPTSHASSGSGTLSSPYLICNTTQLQSLINTTSDWDKFYEIRNDLDLGSLTSVNDYYLGTQTNRFSGYIDGKNKAFSNLGKTFFGYTKTATLKDLTFSAIDISVAGIAAGIALESINSRFENITLKGSVTSTGSSAAGFVQSSSSSMYFGVYNEMTVTAAANNSGGIVGKSLFDGFLKCSNTGNISSPGSSYIGGIVGSMTSGSMKGCFNRGNISAYGYIAGIAGTINSNLIASEKGIKRSIVKDTYNTGNITATNNYSGGIAGSSSGLIYTSYSTGVIIGRARVGGLLGGFSPTQGGEIHNSFSTGNVTANYTASSGVTIGRSGTYSGIYTSLEVTCNGSNATGLQEFNGRHSLNTDFYDQTKAPLTRFDFITETAIGLDDVWVTPNGSYPKLWFEETTDTWTSPFSGSGSITDPYLISSLSDWSKIQENPRLIGGHLKLSEDLDFNSNTFNPLSFGFAGTLDGNNKIMSNITLSSGGLIESIFAGSVIQNMAVNNFTNTTDTHSVLANSNSGYLNNITVSNSSITGAGNMGGITSVNMGTIYKSSVSNNTIVSTGKYAGGLVSSNYFGGKISNSSSSGTLTNNHYYTGGIAGVNYEATIEKSFSTMTVNSNTSYTGGLVGENYSTDSNSYFQSQVSNSYYNGVMTAASYNGGIVGRNFNSVIKNTFSSGSINSTSQVGGIVGKIEQSSGTAQISNSFSIMNITANGGLRDYVIGENSSGTITNVVSYSGATCACSNNASSSSTTLSDFYSSSNAPLSSWDFTTIWQENSGSPPTLR